MANENSTTFGWRLIAITGGLGIVIFFSLLLVGEMEHPCGCDVRFGRAFRDLLERAAGPPSSIHEVFRKGVRVNRISPAHIRDPGEVDVPKPRIDGPALQKFGQGASNAEPIPGRGRAVKCGFLDEEPLKASDHNL